LACLRKGLRSVGPPTSTIALIRVNLCDCEPATSGMLCKALAVFRINLYELTCASLGPTTWGFSHLELRYYARTTAHATAIAQTVIRSTPMTEWLVVIVVVTGGGYSGWSHFGHPNLNVGCGHRQPECDSLPVLSVRTFILRIAQARASVWGKPYLACRRTTTSISQARVTLNLSSTALSLTLILPGIRTVQVNETNNLLMGIFRGQLVGEARVVNVIPDETMDICFVA
jgi:hypothetical protein